MSARAKPPPRNLYIAGIGGSFMGGVAQLAREVGFAVRGCDTKVYSPMREILQRNEIHFAETYSPEHLGDAGTILIGNVLSRGNALVEHILANKLVYKSAPEWLYENVLREREVIAVAGTHGKTTTAAMLAWILEFAGRNPGFLIGGQPGNFNESARLGSGELFVVEADEYDTAFFDKRAKFVHYRPQIAVLNNLEFDHSDIYENLAQIKRQFHHLLRVVSPTGCVVVNAADANLREVIAMGCWSKLVGFAADETTGEVEFTARAACADCTKFEILQRNKTIARVTWGVAGAHNMHNALAAITAAAQVGVGVTAAAKSLREFIPPARRLQLLFQSPAVTLYDDFAHHPSAIAATITAARAKHPAARIIAVVELRSNTMKMGSHGDALVAALKLADAAVVAGPPVEYLRELTGQANATYITAAAKITAAVQKLRREQVSEMDVIITMSNGDFGGAPKKLAAELRATSRATSNS